MSGLERYLYRPNPLILSSHREPAWNRILVPFSGYHTCQCSWLELAQVDLVARSWSPTTLSQLLPVRDEGIATGSWDHHGRVGVFAGAEDLRQLVAIRSPGSPMLSGSCTR